MKNFACFYSVYPVTAATNLLATFFNITSHPHDLKEFLYIEFITHSILFDIIDEVYNISVFSIGLLQIGCYICI